METIIQQIVAELARKIVTRAYSGGISDVDALASDVLGDCKAASVSIIATICSELNLEIRQDKVRRKEQALVLKEKDRPRELLTELGSLNLPRDYYYDKRNGRYIALLDHVIGIRPYERVGDMLSAKMATCATDVSYGRSASIVTGGVVSRQTVKNKVQKLPLLEKEPGWGTKKEVKELHIYADEDHAHLQKPNKERGKASKIVPLVTVTEGIETKCERRHRTIAPMHFVDDKFSTKELWKSAEGYIGKAYNLEKLETIYVHGDGGSWIQSGLNNLPRVIHVMDGYHLEKRIKDLSRMFPGKGVIQRIHHAIDDDDRKYAGRVLQSLYEEAEDEKQLRSISDFGVYLMRNWEQIVRRRTLDIPGSCTEGLVSHVLSERISRDPVGWSEKGLGKIAKLRVYVKNGGEIKAEHFKTEQKPSYSDYADQIIEEGMSGATDWSIFDGEPFVFNGASGTRTLVHQIGVAKSTIWS